MLSGEKTLLFDLKEPQLHSIFWFRVGQSLAANEASFFILIVARLHRLLGSVGTRSNMSGRVRLRPLSACLGLPG